MMSSLVKPSHTKSNVFFPLARVTFRPTSSDMRVLFSYKLYSVYLRKMLIPYFFVVPSLSTFELNKLIAHSVISTRSVLQSSDTLPSLLIRPSSIFATIDSRKCQVSPGMWRGSVNANPSRSSHQLLSLRIRWNSSYTSPHLHIFSSPSLTSYAP